MAWIYLAESADSVWPLHHGSDLSPTVRTTDSLSLFCCLGCDAVRFLPLQFGTTSPRSYLSCCPDRKLISSTAASPARISALQELEQAWAVSEAGLSSTSSESLATADPASSSWRTSQLSLFGGLTGFSWNSMRWGMTRAGRLFQPQKWAPRTFESESGFFPTPAASEYGSSNNGHPSREEYATKGKPSLSTMARKGLWPTPMASDGSKGPTQFARGNPSLGAAVKLWPTPTVCGNHNAPKEGTDRGFGLSTAVKRWPTPTASEGAKGGPGRRYAEASASSPAGGQLNPTWVEWLMGYPCEWTVLEAWATQWFRPARAKRS
jgi:hypothetical protein